MYFKFVVGGEQDQEDIKDAMATYKNVGVDVPIYLMPMGGCYEEYRQNAKEVAEMAMAKGYRYSPRLYADLWNNGWGT